MVLLLGVLVMRLLVVAEAHRVIACRQDQALRDAEVRPHEASVVGTAPQALIGTRIAVATVQSESEDVQPPDVRIDIEADTIETVVNTERGGFFFAMLLEHLVGVSLFSELVLMHLEVLRARVSEEAEVRPGDRLGEPAEHVGEAL